MDWDKLRIFYAVAQTKSLKRAGEMLATSSSAISRQIAALEERLKITLFHRHPHGMVLTEQGEILYKTVCEMVAKLQTAETALAESSSRPSGTLKVTAPTAFGSIWLTPIFKEFLALYPEIELTLIMEDRELDLSLREADVAIRMFPSKQPDLIQIPLVELHSSIYASNDYLRDHGVPSSLKDLVNHRLIVYPNNQAQPSPHINWLFERPEAKKLQLRPYLQLNSLAAIRRAVKSGIGIAPLPDYIMYRARHISKVMPDIISPVTQAYYVYSVELKNSRRVSVFRAFLERKIAESKF